MLKRRKPVTPGQRHVRRRKVETEGGRKRVASQLRRGKRQSAGRNNRGRVTVRHRGGGVKRVRRKRVNGGKEIGVGRVRGVQYDPNRTGRVARRKVREQDKDRGEVKAEYKNRYKYVLAAEGRRVGDRIQYGEVAGSGEEVSFALRRTTKLGAQHQGSDGASVKRESKRGMTAEGGVASLLSKVQRRGSTRKRKNRVAGILVSNIEVKPGEGGKYRRTAGARGEVRQKRPGRVQIRRKGGKRREVSDECTATVGMVSGEEHMKECKGKAGRNRRRGWRPTVRGEAMNPIDHPHGGRTRGGRPEVTPWARRAKGKPTRKASSGTKGSKGKKGVVTSLVYGG